MTSSPSFSGLTIDDLDTSALTDEEKRELAALLSEANSRNIEIPLEKLDRTKTVFPVDDNGYFIKDDGSHYRATESHEGFLKSIARFVLFYGGRGAGKSAAGAQKALNKIKQGLDGTIINPKFEDFKTSTWEEFRKWIPPSTVVPKHRYRLDPSWEPMRPFVLSFMNGAKVYCKGLKDPDSARGANVNWLWYDEGGSDVDGKGWRIAIAAVRVGHMPQAWVTSTPNGVLHWMHDFFMDEEKIKQYEEMDELRDSDRPFVETFRGSTEENKGNLDPAFYASMLSTYSGWEREQEIEGGFVSHGGVLGDFRWFKDKRLDVIPDGLVIQNRVRYWDLAATEKKAGVDPDRTVGTLMSYAKWDAGENSKILREMGHPEGRDAFFIEDQEGGFWEWDEILTNIFRTAMSKDFYFVKIRIEQEPGSGGKNQVSAIKSAVTKLCEEKGVPVFDIDGNIPDGDKVMRANIWFGEAKKGQIYIINGSWVEPFSKILNGFPMLKHDDEVDSVSGARVSCSPIRTWKRIAFLKV